MSIVAAVVALFLAVAMTISAIGKLTRMPQVVASLDAAKVPHSMFPLLAGIQLVGALGLVVGLRMSWAGVAAGVGFFLYFLLAAGYHLRAGDRGGMAPALSLAVLGLAAALTRLAA